jgi:hypothetical protein
MAKKKLSRDQKRKQKKQRRKQKPHPGKSKRRNPQIKILKPGAEELIQAQTSFKEQEKRIKQVFGTEEIPSVKANTLRTYSNYLKINLEVPCLLTGIESMGYFAWEERFAFGYGSKTEYERIRKEQGSYRDQYELKVFEAEIEPEWDMWVDVKRTADGRQFTIPLSELQAVDKTSKHYELLHDYSVWIVNWR